MRRGGGRLVFAPVYIIEWRVQRVSLMNSGTHIVLCIIDATVIHNFMAALCFAYNNVGTISWICKYVFNWLIYLFIDLVIRTVNRIRVTFCGIQRRKDAHFSVFKYYCNTEYVPDL